MNGNTELLNKSAIAVVGSRSCSSYGEKMCEYFTKELVKRNFIIVSGMAKGIDSIAHIICLENGGKTIAVLPSGFNNIFPKENIKLFKDIINLESTVITEYAPNVTVDSKKFLQRNRIVAGISVGTLIIEAGYRSGTSVTARFTKEQGKKFFCVPSSLENKKGITSNELIKRGGILVTNVTDIIKELPESELPIMQEKSAEISEKFKQAKVSEELMDIYNILSFEPKYIDEISKISGLPIKEVNYKLMMLEIENNIIQLSGRRFVKK